MADAKAWNPWHGCRRYSEGCEHCYMYFLDKAHGVPEWSRDIRRTGDFSKPLRKDRKGRYKLPAGYFLRVNMTSDTFIEEADPWRDEMWSIVRRRPDVRFYLLTKRAGRIAECLPGDWGEGYKNVELNTTVENQRTFDERWPVFERIPARHKGLNLSPLLGPVDIEPALASDQIENVGVAGEGYGGERPCHYEWLRDTAKACEHHRVNFCVQALGTVFVKDGRMYRLRGQRLQGEQAFYSGLTRFYGNPTYELFDPTDGHPLTDEELIRPVYNLERCKTCSMLPTCIGCTDCGTCKNVELLGRSEMLDLQSELLKSRQGGSGSSTRAPSG